MQLWFDPGSDPRKTRVPIVRDGSRSQPGSGETRSEDRNASGDEQGCRLACIAVVVGEEDALDGREFAQAVGVDPCRRVDDESLPVFDERVGGRSAGGAPDFLVHALPRRCLEFDGRASGGEDSRNKKKL